MGLCKCPKKRVTNLFCFAHKVNVCEHCMVEQHSRCVVQSYLKWLEDSDYDPTCIFCAHSLEEGDVVRLVCFDLCHVSCIHRYAQSLAHGTPHSEYLCPKCQGPIFPPEKLVSPVAEALRQVLSRFSWALQGGALLPPPAPPTMPDEDEGDTSFGPTLTSTPFSTPDRSVHQRPTAMEGGALHAVGGDFTDAANSVGEHLQGDYRYHPSVDGRDQVIDIVGRDQDEDKYKKRSSSHWLARWLRNHQMNSVSDEFTSMRRTIVIVILVIVAFVTVIVIFTRVGRSVANRDPLLDPEANPNLHFGGQQPLLDPEANPNLHVGEQQ